MIFRILLFISISFLVPDISAQKRKKEKDVPPAFGLSEDVRMKAESSFIEAEKQLLLENYTKAFDLFLLANELNPNNAAIHYKLSEVMVKTGDYERGIDYISDAISLDPDNKYYYIFKADVLTSQQRFSEAVEVYQDLIARIPGTEQYLYDLASIYQYQEKWDKAIEYYDRAEVKFGKSEAVMYEKQKIYLRQNNMKNLIVEWDEFILQNPHEPRYVLELCNILIANNMDEEAVLRLEKYNTDYPDDPNSYLLLSEISRKNGDFQQSLKYLSRPVSSLQVEIGPKIQLLNNYLALSENFEVRPQLITLVDELVETHPESYDAIAFAGDVFFQFQELDRSLVYYLKAVSISPANFAAWNNIISIESQKEAFDSLILHTERALEFFPNQSILYYYNGWANYIQKNFQKAVRSLEQGKKYTSDPGLLTVFYGQLGDAYNSLKEYEKSDESYESALKNDPDNDHVLNNYSYFLSLRGSQLEKAVSMSKKLIERNPDNGTYLDTYGWVLYMTGDYISAEKILKKASEIEEDGTIIEHYGDVLFKLGQEIEAVEQWKRAKELGGTTDEIDRKIAERMIYE